MIYTIYIDALFCTKSFQKVVGLSFSKLNFKETSVYKLPQSSDMFTKSSDKLEPL